MPAQVCGSRLKTARKHDAGIDIDRLRPAMQERSVTASMPEGHLRMLDCSRFFLGESGSDGVRDSHARVDCLRSAASMMGLAPQPFQTAAQLDQIKLAVDGASFAGSGKTLTDHAISIATGYDCSLTSALHLMQVRAGAKLQFTDCRHQYRRGPTSAASATRRKPQNSRVRPQRCRTRCAPSFRRDDLH